MLATAGTNTESTQARGITQAITVTPTVAEMPETVMTPAPCDFSMRKPVRTQKFLKKVKRPMLLVR